MGLGDLFESFFGRRAKRGPRKGEDLEVVLEVSLEEAYAGTRRTVEAPRWNACDRCGGSGAEPGSQVLRCPTCGGTGQVTQRSSSIFGQFVRVFECPDCRGSGKRVEKRCSRCGGSGFVRNVRRVEVEIEPGVESGLRYRIPGAGGLGERGAPPGDLYVLVRVKPHPRFEREGDDLIYRAKVSFVRAALGGTLAIEHLDGSRVEVEIPPGTQPGAVLTLKGRGMPRFRSRGRGDLRVVVEVEVPRRLSPRARKLLEELEREL